MYLSESWATPTCWDFVSQTCVNTEDFVVIIWDIPNYTNTYQPLKSAGLLLKGLLLKVAIL